MSMFFDSMSFPAHQIQFDDSPILPVSDNSNSEKKNTENCKKCLSTKLSADFVLILVVLSIFFIEIENKNMTILRVTWLCF